MILFDIIQPAQNLPEGITFIRGDIRCLSDVETAFQDAEVACVFHIASYGMSGREQLNKTQIEEVNVGGTENILQACLERGVPSLVYTSTFNVIFGGQVIRNGDESLPYLPLHLHPSLIRLVVYFQSSTWCLTKTFCSKSSRIWEWKLEVGHRP